MKVEKGKKVKVIYKLYDASDNSYLEKTPENNPPVFEIGAGNLFPEFEKNLLGLEEGDKFDFVIKAEDAYGPIDTYAIFDIPKETFAIDGKIDESFFSPGKKVPMHDNNGIQHIGRMIKILDDVVTMDFNHPLAGKDLRYIGEILEVK